MNSLKTCPGCGNNDPWVDPKHPTSNKCKSCSREYEDGEASGIQPKTVPQPLQDQGGVEPEVETENNSGSSTASTIAGIILVVIMLGGLIAMLIGMVRSINKETERAAVVNTIGQYEVLPLECPDGSQGIAVEYGFTNKEPFLEVFPGVEGADRWSITAEQADQIALEHSNSYLWVHCVNSENLPEYYSQGTLSAKPQDGMQVVYKRK